MDHKKLVEIAAFSPLSLQFPNAWIGHTPFAAFITRELAPNIFVELGTHSGNSYFSFCQAVKEFKLPTKCYAVDTWQGDEHSGTYTEQVFDFVNNHNNTHYGDFSQLLRTTFNEAVAKFEDGSIDMLHIDGLHTYEAVSHDFQTWLPKLSPGAVVLFHDTNVIRPDFGVRQFWQELQACYPNNLEFLHSHGLGVLQLNDAPEQKQNSWLQSAVSDPQKLISYFYHLGARQMERYDLALFHSQVTDLNAQVKMLHNTIAERDKQIKQLTEELDQSIIRKLTRFFKNSSDRNL